MESTKMNFKQILLTAFVTCFFTVIAGAITYLITQPKASLTYTVASGPTLSSGNLHKRIYSINVKNAGRKEVETLALQVNIEKGKIEEVTAEASPGLKVTENKMDNEYLATTPSMNPKEVLAVSLMVCLDTPEASPVISVRGKGISGIVEEKKENRKINIIFLVIGAIASLLGVMASIAPMTRRIIGRTIPSKMVEAFASRDTMVGPFERNELIAYILGICGLPQQSNQIRFAPSEISFRGAADFILAEALTSKDEEIKGNLILAMKCMLLIKEIAPESIEIVTKGLNSLADLTIEEISEIRNRAIDQWEKPAELRTGLFSYARSNGTELPQQNAGEDAENTGGPEG